MKTKKLLSSSSVFLFLTLSAFGQSGLLQGGGGLKVSQAYITGNFIGLDAIYGNPGVLVLSETTWNIDVSAEYRFGLEELSTFSGAFLYKKGKNAFGLSYIRYGTNEYNERKFSFSYGRTLFNNLHIGANFNSITYAISQFGSTSLLSFDAGIFSQVTKQISLGIQFNNPISINITEKNKLPERLSAVMIYSPSNKVSLCSEFEKIIDRPISTKLGISYMLVNQLQLRIGYDISRSFLGAGVAYAFGNYRLVGGVTFNDLLGNSPGVNIQYRK